MREERSCGCYSPGAVAAASANGLPSESRHTAHRSPGWMIEPPSSRTRSTVVARSATVKYGREAVSPGPGPRSVDSETQAVGVGLPPRSGRGGPWREGDPEDSVPELRARRVRRPEIDQWRGHGREYGWRIVFAFPLRDMQLFPGGRISPTGGDVLAGIIGWRRAWTVSMISALSMPCSRWRSLARRRCPERGPAQVVRISRCEIEQPGHVVGRHASHPALGADAPLASSG